VRAYERKYKANWEEYCRAREDCSRQCIFRCHGITANTSFASDVPYPYAKRQRSVWHTATTTGCVVVRPDRSDRASWCDNREDGECDLYSAERISNRWRETCRTSTGFRAACRRIVDRSPTGTATPRFFSIIFFPSCYEYHACIPEGARYSLRRDINVFAAVIVSRFVYADIRFLAHPATGSITKFAHGSRKGHELQPRCSGDKVFSADE